MRTTPHKKPYVAPLLQREDSNTKTAKNNQYTWSLSLAQAKVSGREVCPFRSNGCTAVCVGKAGLAIVFSRIMEARIRKTKLFFENRGHFLAKLLRELELADIYCAKKNTIGLVRLNTFSDISWHKMINVEVYKNLKFYDYTKNLKSVYECMEIPNYRKCYSYSENSNWADIKQLLDSGGNVTVVFKDIEYKPSHGKIGPMPDTFMGYKVVDGDKTDNRFDDPRGVIVGLRLKGNIANKKIACDSGFAINAFGTSANLTIGGI